MPGPRLRFREWAKRPASARRWPWRAAPPTYPLEVRREVERRGAHLAVDEAPPAPVRTR